MSLQRGINLRALAEKMGQCSGAEVRGICTEAGMYALRERRQHVTQEDFEFAVAKVCRVVQDKWPVLTLVINRYSRRTKRGTHLSTNCSRNCIILWHLDFLAVWCSFGDFMQIVVYHCRGDLRL